MEEKKLYQVNNNNHLTEQFQEPPQIEQQQIDNF